MLEIAVIGAGASGIVASRHLLGHGLRPCIFEASSTLGGAWKKDHAGKMWQGLTTNLSKHTCRFSEWPWPTTTSSAFPTSLELHDYLESYADHFVTAVDPTCFLYDCQVTNVQAIGAQQQASSSQEEEVGQQYRVEWKNVKDQTHHSKDFAGVVVASGFFSQPSYPDCVQRIQLDSTKLPSSPFLFHSSHYQSPDIFANQTVAVVGSSFSAMEIAVDLSQSAKRVIHIVNRVPWVLPRWIPSPVVDNDSNNTILPFDVAFYRRTKSGLQIPEVTQLTPKDCKEKHSALKSLVGTKQQRTPLGIPTDHKEPPHVAISDYYLDLVSQGDIEVVRGRLEDIDQDDFGVKVVNGSNDGSTNENVTTIILPNLDRIICCTGYQSNFDFLDDSILKTLEYDPTVDSSYSPLSLCWDTMHPALPNLFFCGTYRGPYMGIMEQQGRLAARLLSRNGLNNIITKEKQDEALQVSKQMRSLRPRPQFPHFDYLGFLDTLTSLQEAPYPNINTEKGDSVSPAFYQDVDPSISEQEKQELEALYRNGNDGSRIPSLLLSAIIGKWSFRRTIVHVSEDREEKVSGTVKYSRPKLSHVLYREDGQYEYLSGKVMDVFREYEYVVKDDTLEVYFVEAGERALLFLSLKFSHINDQGYWVATSDHLCIKDLYKANFQVQLSGLSATELIITYQVKGPSKDYISTTYLSPR